MLMSQGGLPHGFTYVKVDNIEWYLTFTLSLMLYIVGPDSPLHHSDIWHPAMKVCNYETDSE